MLVHEHNKQYLILSISSLGLLICIIIIIIIIIHYLFNQFDNSRVN